MVDVAQLVEPRIVIPAVAGSSPVVHPTSWWGVERGVWFEWLKFAIGRRFDPYTAHHPRTLRDVRGRPLRLEDRDKSLRISTENLVSTSVDVHSRSVAASCGRGLLGGISSFGMKDQAQPFVEAIDIAVA